MGRRVTTDQMENEVTKGTKEPEVKPENPDWPGMLVAAMDRRQLEPKASQEQRAAREKWDHLPIHLVNMNEY